MADCSDISFEWCDNAVFGLSPIPEEDVDEVRPPTTVQEQPTQTQKVMETAINGPPSTGRALIVGIISTSSLLRTKAISNPYHIFKGPRGHLN